MRVYLRTQLERRDVMTLEPRKTTENWFHMPPVWVTCLAIGTFQGLSRLPLGGEKRSSSLVSQPFGTFRWSGPANWCKWSSQAGQNMTVDLLITDETPFSTFRLYQLAQNDSIIAFKMQTICWACLLSNHWFQLGWLAATFSTPVVALTYTADYVDTEDFGETPVPLSFLPFSS